MLSERVASARKRLALSVITRTMAVNIFADARPSTSRRPPLPSWERGLARALSDSWGVRGRGPASQPPVLVGHPLARLANLTFNPAPLCLSVTDGFSSSLCPPRSSTRQSRTISARISVASIIAK